MKNEKGNGKTLLMLVLAIGFGFVSGCCVSQEKQKKTKADMLRLRALYERDRLPMKGEKGRSVKPMLSSRRGAFMTLIKSIYISYSKKGTEFPKLEAVKEPKKVEEKK